MKAERLETGTEIYIAIHGTKLVANTIPQTKACKFGLCEVMEITDVPLRVLAGIFILKGESPAL